MNSTKYLVILFLIVLSITANAQLQRTKHFHKQSEVLSFCGETVILDSIGYFFKDEGCEGQSEVSFGKYKLSKNNVVTFKPLPFDSLKPIRKIKRTKVTTNTDSTITITLYDIHNKLVSIGANVEVVDKNGLSERIYVDKKGQIMLNRNLHKDIIFSSLLWIFKGSPSIIQDGDSTIEVYLGLPDLFLWQTTITTIKSKQTQLLVKKNGLYKLDGRTKIYSQSR
jgi:hypothetical protein